MLQRFMQTLGKVAEPKDMQAIIRPVLLKLEGQTRNPIAHMKQKSGICACMCPASPLFWSKNDETLLSGMMKRS